MSSGNGDVNVVDGDARRQDVHRQGRGRYGHVHALWSADVKGNDGLVGGSARNGVAKGELPSFCLVRQVERGEVTIIQSYVARGPLLVIDGPAGTLRPGVVGLEARYHGPRRSYGRPRNLRYLSAAQGRQTTGEGDLLPDQHALRRCNVGSR